jgi:hypothetical protein
LSGALSRRLLQQASITQGSVMRAHVVSLIPLLWLAFGIAPISARAEELTAVSTASVARDRLFAELAADVAELERQGSILKRVV